MSLFNAVMKISARELTRRVVWFGAYLAAIMAKQSFPKSTAKVAIQDYENQFPKS